MAVIDTLAWQSVFHIQIGGKTWILPQILSPNGAKINTALKYPFIWVPTLGDIFADIRLLFHTFTSHTF